MSEDLRNLADRIREEMTELALVVERVKEGWQRAKASSDDFYLDAVALNLHGFSINDSGTYRPKSARS